MLAGRDDQLTSIITALRLGPQAPGFCQAILGDRGVGKTVLLNEVERRVRADLDWPVLSHQATPGGDLTASILEKLPKAADGVWRRAGRLLRELDKQVTIGANLGVVRADVTVSSPRPNLVGAADRLERVLRTVGEFARSRHSGVLVTVDEAHVVSRLPDLAALGAAMQMVVRRAQLPVAVVLAGLPELRLRFHGVGTFLERMETIDIAYLGRDATRFALVQPAAELGVAFDTDALELLVNESGGYPYLVQVLGYETWEAAGGVGRINREHATRGVVASRQRMAGLFRARWDRLSDLEQRYLAEVAELGPGAVPVSAIAQALHRTTKQLSTTRAALIDDHRLLTSPRYGHVELMVGGFAQWAQSQNVINRGPAGRSRYRQEPEGGETSVSGVTGERPSSPKLRSS